MGKLVESDEIADRWEALRNIAETMDIALARYKTLSFIIENSDDNFEVPLFIRTLDTFMGGYIASVATQWKEYKDECAKRFDADLKKIEEPSCE